MRSLGTEFRLCNSVSEELLGEIVPFHTDPFVVDGIGLACITRPWLHLTID